MSQATNYQIAVNQSGTGYRTQDNDRIIAILTQHSGSSRPSYIQTGMIWLDTTSTTPAILKLYDGASDVTIGSFNFTTHTLAFPSASDTVTGVVELATNAEAITGTDAVRAMTPAASLAGLQGAAHTFTKTQSVAPVALTSSGASVAIDLSLGNNFSHTLTENTTLANPSNIVAGTSGQFVFTNHASSPKTLAFSSYFHFPGGTIPTLTATNGAVDLLLWYANSTTSLVCNLVKAFS